LNELDSALLPGVGPEKATLGLVDLSTPGTPAGLPMMFDDEISENPGVGTVEIWEIYNFTADAHPIHLHQTMFEVINREVFDPALPEVGEERDPEAWESGFKDTVIAYPGEITRIKARFDLPGLYVWHCHIVDHEDNEMMRPYYVGPIPAAVRRLLIKK
jgi:spore coat protein A, manganese oxidase